MKKREISEAEVLGVLGETIRRLRKCTGVSQAELGNALNLHQTAVCRIENAEQSIHPWQLQQLAKFYSITVSSLLTGRVNYWQVSVRFGRKPLFPKRYLEFPHSKVRELLPLLQYLRVKKGQERLDEILASLDLAPGFLLEPDQPIGVNATLDLFRLLGEGKPLEVSDLTSLVEETRSEEVQGVLHPIYQTQTEALNLIKILFLNAHHYETNFRYEMRDEGSHELRVSIAPAEHMKNLDYRGAELGDVLCRYKREYVARFPQYIGQAAASVQEQECHFKGAKRCVYLIRAA